MIRIVLADDHNVVLQGVKQVLRLADDFDVVGEASDGWQVISQLRATVADLLITDISMPGPHGIELVKRVKEEHPRLPILAFTMHADNQIVTRTLNAGASGYLTKDCEPEELIAAIRRTARGHRYIDASLTQKLLLATTSPHTALPHSQLSNRELEIFTLLARGITVTAIANDLNLSPKTVSTHKARLMLKLDISSSAELVRYALRHGLVE